jgi:signal transduction histidine kinase
MNKKEYKFPIILSLVLLIYSTFQLVRAFNISKMDQNYDLLTGSVLDNWFLVISLFVISASSIGFIMLLKELDEKTIRTKNLIIQNDKVKLEMLNRTQNKLFSIIAHDLRSPFNNIIGLSELLLENLKDTNDKESEKCVGFINSTAENTLNLLDNLLHWAKSQTGELDYKPEKIILTDVILETIELQTSLATAKNIWLQYSAIEDIEVHTDKNILATILRNLISNAIKFTNPEGHIIVTATKKENQVEISVADNGVGMSEETIQNIFDPSIKVTSKGTSNENGSGFGLMLCREFVEKLDGQLLIESEEGKGSNFKFTLPWGKESN